MRYQIQLHCIDESFKDYGGELLLLLHEKRGGFEGDLCYKKNYATVFLSLTSVHSLPGAVKPSVTLESKFQSPRFLEIKRAFLSRQLPECHVVFFFFPSENEDELVQVAAVV